MHFDTIFCLSGFIYAICRVSGQFPLERTSRGPECMRTRSPRQKQQKKVADRSLEPVRSKVEHTTCKNPELPDKHKDIYSLIHIAFVTLLINHSEQSLDKMGNVSTTAGSTHHLDTEILTDQRPALILGSIHHSRIDREPKHNRNESVPPRTHPRELHPKTSPTP